jgi:hypothetical protein
VEAATEEAVEEFGKIHRCSSVKKRLCKGLLDQIIKKSKLKHGVDGGEGGNHPEKYSKATA